MTFLNLCSLSVAVMIEFIRAHCLYSYKSSVCILALQMTYLKPAKFDCLVPPVVHGECLPLPGGHDSLTLPSNSASQGAVPLGSAGLLETASLRSGGIQALLMEVYTVAFDQI